MNNVHEKDYEDSISEMNLTISDTNSSKHTRMDIIRTCSSNTDSKFYKLLQIPNSESSYSTFIILDSLQIADRDKQKLSPIALESIQVDNAGGKSDISEMYSIEHYIRSFSATDIVYEMQVEYWIDYKMVDYVCTIPIVNVNKRIGVSVTRAMCYSNPEHFTVQDGKDLLYKKIFGLIVARNATCKKHRFYKSILHVWCQTERIANILADIYASFDIADLDLKVKGLLVLHLTVCDYFPIYLNRYTLEKPKKLKFC